MSPVAIEYCYHTIEINDTHKTIPYIYGVNK